MLRISRRIPLLFSATAALFVACGIVPACHLINGIDDFTTDPSLDLPPPTPCNTENDCPGTDTECSKRACVENACVPMLAPKGTTVLQQIIADCKSNQCDGVGNRVDGVVDPSDVLDDGKECTLDACSGTGEPTNEPLAAGTKCAMGTMVCDGKGACVECASDTDCATGLVCFMNHCVPKGCINQMKDGQESDTDCGGQECPPCATGLACTIGSDCQSNLCDMGKCAEPSCSDGQKNGSETDVDCGATCNPCADGLGCSIGMDCMSQVCKMNVCQAAACDDGIQNGDEIHIDCGGSCAGCSEGSTCTTNADCGSEFCLSGTCAKIIQVATGTVHTCAVVEAMPGEGKVYCWGGNDYGELGTGAVNTSQPQPTDPVNLSNVTSVSTSSNYGSSLGSHNCARYVPPNGTAKYACWGRNDNKQLGNTNAPSPSLQPYDIQFAASITPTQVVVGGRHTCAITANTHVQCWGANGNGQCGVNSTTTPIAQPKGVYASNPQIPLGAAQLALGSVFTCARLLTTGDVACWGNNGHGQLGFNATNQLTPRKMTTITGVMELAVGQDFTCGRNGSGLFCWGDDSDKQFGEDAQAAQITPLLVKNVPAIELPLTLGSAGPAGMPDVNGGHNCAIVANGKLMCFGLNDRGQAGTGNNTNPVVPSEINIEPVKQVSLGTQFTCALLQIGAIRCWGRNDFGQLGNGTLVDSNIPSRIKWPDP